MMTSNPRVKPSCTTTGIYVGQDRETNFLRSGTTPIVYRGGVSAIGLIRKGLSCTTFFPLVVQDKEGHNAA